MALAQDFLEAIHGLLLSPQQAFSVRFSGILDEWEEYFTRLDIPQNGQRAEFVGIMHARVQSGIISIVAPLDELNRLDK